MNIMVIYFNIAPEHGQKPPGQNCFQKHNSAVHLLTPSKFSAIK